MAISPSDFDEKSKLCKKYVDSHDYSQFLTSFQQLSDLTRNSEEFTRKLNDLKQFAVDEKIKELETTESFDDYIQHLRILDDIIKDKKQLWDVMNSLTGTQLKVTLNQSQMIATAFFSPVMLFEFGFDSFYTSRLCDFKNIMNEEALVDIFYAIAGFVSACRLEPTYVSNVPQYLELIRKLLSMFIKLQDFDPYRFVWLVEAIHEHLHCPNTLLKQTCVDVIQDYLNEEEKHAINKLYKLCVISTSPFLHQLDILRESIDSIFQTVIEEQRLFIRKYIFICFTCNDWTGPRTNKITEPLHCWILYLENLAFRIKDKPELPILLLVDFINDSLSLFAGYYGEVQPTKEKSVNLRIDIFAIVDRIILCYPTEIPPDALKMIWYLLYIAAISGATDFELENIGLTFIDSDEPDTPYLGLEKTQSEFLDYKIALERLGKKFESEKSTLPKMIQFVRQNYFYHQEIDIEQHSPQNQENYIDSII